MLDADVPGTKNHPNYIETKAVTGTLKARHPDFRGAAELALLLPAHRRYGTAERVGSSSLNFDEGYGSLGPVPSFTCRDEINVTVPVPEPALGDLPAVHREPSLRDALAFQSECLPCC